MKTRLVIELILGLVLTVLLCSISYFFVKSPPKNYYTRVATVELLVAIICRFCVGGYYLIHEYDNDHLYDYRFQIPFYMMIKV